MGEQDIFETIRDQFNDLRAERDEWRHKAEVYRDELAKAVTNADMMTSAADSYRTQREEWQRLQQSALEERDLANADRDHWIRLHTADHNRMVQEFHEVKDQRNELPKTKANLHAAIERQQTKIDNQRAEINRLQNVLKYANQGEVQKLVKERDAALTEARDMQVRLECVTKERDGLSRKFNEINQLWKDYNRRENEGKTWLLQSHAAEIAEALEFGFSHYASGRLCDARKAVWDVDAKDKVLAAWRARKELENGTCDGDNKGNFDGDSVLHSVNDPDVLEREEEVAAPTPEHKPWCPWEQMYRDREVDETGHVPCTCERRQGPRERRQGRECLTKAPNGDIYYSLGKPCEWSFMSIQKRVGAAERRKEC